MEKTCYRCDAPIANDAPFCAACGAPQIRVSAPELTPAPPQPESQSEPPEFTYNPPGLAIAPGVILWKTFLRATWPIALLGGVAALTVPIVGFFLLLPLSVVLGVWLYRRRQKVLVRASQGLKLGLAMGLISFAAFAALMLAGLAFSSGVRQEMVRQITIAASRTPEGQQAYLPLLNTPQGFAAFVVILLMFAMVLFLVLTGLTGAVAAATLGEKKR
ncbi:MAG TPA: zinc ribbon domain-containing protein [Terriglobales bacterium]|nr:zinc ribbon domain-containing protein [Terriglobales bacterium]